MTTFLLIVLAVCVVLNIWLGICAIRRERKCRRLLQERMDEHDKIVGELSVEKGRLKIMLDEKTSLVAHLKKVLGRKDNEVQCLNERIIKLEESIRAMKEKEVLAQMDMQPTDIGLPEVDSALEELHNAKDSLQEMKASYDELAKSYDYVSRQYENPSKRYIINNLVKLYEVKSITSLAKVLGVSASSLTQKIKK